MHNKDFFDIVGNLLHMMYKKIYSLQYTRKI